MLTSSVSKVMFYSTHSVTNFQKGEGGTGLQAPKAQQKLQTPRVNPGKESRFARTRWRGKALCLAGHPSSRSLSGSSDSQTFWRQLGCTGMSVAG